MLKIRVLKITLITMTHQLLPFSLCASEFQINSLVYRLRYILGTYLSCTSINIGISESLLRLNMPCYIKWLLMQKVREGDLQFYHDSLWLKEPKISLGIIEIGLNCQMLDGSIRTIIHTWLRNSNGCRQWSSLENLK